MTERQKKARLEHLVRLAYRLHDEYQHRYYKEPYGFLISNDDWMLARMLLAPPPPPSWAWVSSSFPYDVRSNSLFFMGLPVMVGRDLPDGSMGIIDSMALGSRSPVSNPILPEPPPLDTSPSPNVEIKTGKK